MPRCRICNADNDYQEIRSEVVYGGDENHKFWKCSQCAAIYLYPPPSVEEEERFYRQEFEKFMADRSGDASRWESVEAHILQNQEVVERRWPFLEEFIHPGKKILEIGCSSGFMLNAFKNKGMECTGVEPSGIFKRYLQGQGYEIFENTDDVILENNKTFDVIVHFFVLEHIRDPFHFFDQLMALLKDDGVMIAEIPCANDPLTHLYRIPAFESFYWSIAHHYYYNPQSLAFVLDRMNLNYKLVPEQRYDLSNHIIWMTEGKPGGQGKYTSVFSEELISRYKEDLKRTWCCDTLFLYIYKNRQK